jgi:hypothetical protein
MGRTLRNGKSCVAPCKRTSGRNVRKYAAHVKKRSKARKELEAMDVDVENRVTTRRRLQLEAVANANTPDSLTGGTVSTPPLEPTVRQTRTSRAKVTCSSYGVGRLGQYKNQGYFFCGPCDLYDAIPNDLKKNCSRNSQAHGCQANHQCYIFPTDKGKEHKDKRTKATLQRVLFKAMEKKASNFKKKAKDKSDDSESDDSSVSVVAMGDEEHTQAVVDHAVSTVQTSPLHDSSTSSEEEEMDDLSMDEEPDVSSPDVATIDVEVPIPTTVNQDVRDEILLQMQARIDSLERQNQDLLKENSELKESKKNNALPVGESPTDEIESENKRFSRLLTKALEKTIATDKRFCRWGKKRTGQHLVNVISEYKDGLCQPAMMKHAKTYLREYVFHPMKILRAMDLAGGTLGYAGYEIIRNLETDGEKFKRGCLLPSTTEIQRWAKKVEDVAKVLCPMRNYMTPHGECIEMSDYKKTLLLLTRRFRMLETALQRKISWSQAMDGAKISNRESHTCNGAKLSDICARDPVTGEFILLDPNGGKAQSRDLCIVFKMLFCRETGESVMEFKDVFDFFQSCASEDPAVNPLMEEGLKPIDLKITCDMALSWKGLCKGSGFQRDKIRPCHMCSRRASFWAVENPEPCQSWCKELHSNHEGYKCFHCPLDDDENLQKKAKEIAHLRELVSTTYDEIRTLTKLQKDEDPDHPPVNAESKSNSIFFKPKTPAQSKRYNILITNELVLRKLDLGGSLNERKRRLKLAVRNERKLEILMKDLDHSKKQDNALFLLLQCIPCILHLENRVGLKMLTMLLTDGLTSAKDGTLYGKHLCESKSIEKFLAGVEGILNSAILGDERNPAHVSIPYEPKEKVLGQLTLENTKMRTVMGELNMLIDYCIVDVSDAAKWKLATEYMTSALEKMRQKDDFSREQIISFQGDVDEFAQVWMQLYGHSGMTNYIHMMMSGHLSYYMFKWKNLYRYSQQGWEALNSLLKTFYYRRTQRGGASNNGRGDKTKLLPIAKWLQRRLLWQCGYTRAELETELEKIASEFLDSPQHPQQLFEEPQESLVEDVHGVIGDISELI